MEGDDEEIYTTIRSKTMLPKLGLLFWIISQDILRAELFNRDKEGKEHCEIIYVQSYYLVSLLYFLIKIDK
jgi:hypothetical protein